MTMMATAVDARPGTGYGDLIDKYCIERGRLRVGAHQGHCAACHHQGTFDAAPEHRIEPNWTEFERGRSTGRFDYFCPPVQASTVPSAPAIRPPAGGPAAPPPMGKPPATTGPQSVQAQPSRAPSAAKPGAPPTQSGAVELGERLRALHDAVRIEPGQEPAWLEFVDAVAAATRGQQSSLAGATASERLKVRERSLSERIVALRALDLALARLGAVLKEEQRRVFSAGFMPLLEAM